MLAARHAKYHACAAAYGVVHGIVRGRVAGMQRNHHVRRGGGVVAGNVAQLKMQGGIAVSFCGGAFCYNVGFQVKARHIHGHAEYIHKIMIQHERKVRFAAAEIYYLKRPLRLVCARARDIAAFIQRIAHRFKEPVYLRELIAHGSGKLALLCEHAHIHKRVNRLVLAQNILLFSVMALLRLPGRGRRKRL